LRYKGGDELLLVNARGHNEYMIECQHGVDSELGVNHPLPDPSSWQWGFFGSRAYMSASTYHDGQYFTLVPVNGGDQFKIQTKFGYTGYLGVNGPVSFNDQWQRAYFGTAEYNSQGKYAGGDVFTIEFLD